MMMPLSTLLIQQALLFSLLLQTGLVSGATKRDGEKVRKLRWVTGDAPITYLTKSMSNLEEFKSLILKPMVIERVSGTPGNKLVQKHIKSLLTAMGWQVEEDTFISDTPEGQREFTNIIATSDPEKPQHVVLACHYDSKFFKDRKFVAAMDSAVPCAIILETVRQLKCLLDKGPKSKSSGQDISLQLIFFDGEEAFDKWTDTDSLYGARHLAEQWEKTTFPLDSVTRIKKIRELILLDLIGPSDTHFLQQFASTSTLYQHLVKTEKYLRTNNYLSGKHPNTIFSSNQGWGQIEDDHVPFLQRGVDVMHLISSPFPKVWHKETDDWDHLDFNLIDDFSRIFRVFISNLLHLEPEYSGCRKKKKTEL